MDSGDVAPLTAPGVTSGLTDDQLSNGRSLYQRRAAPEALANLQAVRKVRDKALQVLDQTLEGSDNLDLRQRTGLVNERRRQASTQLGSLRLREI